MSLMGDAPPSNDEELQDNFSGYLFNFFADNTVTVSWDNEMANGTWSIDGTGNDITVIFDIPGLDDINDTWILHEIEIENDGDDNEAEVSFEIGDEDELTFEYIFGSDEYADYVGTNFNDIFAFLVSGPGIIGDPAINNQENIAILPGQIFL